MSLVVFKGTALHTPPMFQLSLGAHTLVHLRYNHKNCYIWLVSSPNSLRTSAETATLLHSSNDGVTFPRSGNEGVTFPGSHMTSCSRRPSCTSAFMFISTCKAGRGCSCLSRPIVLQYCRNDLNMDPPIINIIPAITNNNIRSVDHEFLLKSIQLSSSLVSSRLDLMVSR